MSLGTTEEQMQARACGDFDERHHTTGLTHNIYATAVAFCDGRSKNKLVALLRSRHTLAPMVVVQISVFEPLSLVAERIGGV